MLNRIRNVLSPSSADANSVSSQSSSSGSSPSPPRYKYGRPHFLNLGDEQILASCDHAMRPIIGPSSDHRLPFGYAECINAGKSKWNEDQAVHCHGELNTEKHTIPYEYFGLFDGHAGVGAALYAARQLHHLLHVKLVDAQDDLENKFEEGEPVFIDALIIGAIEVAFNEMDEIIKEDRPSFPNMGGCTALIAVFIFERVYVANAGDSRAVVCNHDGCSLMSNDFTPETERKRLRELAQVKPTLLCREFTYMEYAKLPTVEDLGRRVLYKDAFMQGWSYKTVDPADTKPSIVTGEGKRSRLMGTIGVTRGFGDHDLVAVYQKKVPIKPFLTCRPEILVYTTERPNPSAILVMGTDGLWDVLDGVDVCRILNTHAGTFQEKDKYICAATQIVGRARGTLKDYTWVMKNNRNASLDDISVFVIPIVQNSSKWISKETPWKRTVKTVNSRKKRLSGHPKSAERKEPAKSTFAEKKEPPKSYPPKSEPPRSESLKQKRLFPKTPYPREQLQRFPDLTLASLEEEEEKFLSFSDKFDMSDSDKSDIIPPTSLSAASTSKARKSFQVVEVPGHPKVWKLMAGPSTSKAGTSSRVTPEHPSKIVKPTPPSSSLKAGMIYSTPVSKKRKSPATSPTAARDCGLESFAELELSEPAIMMPSAKRYKVKSCTAKYSPKRTKNSLQIRRVSYFETKGRSKKHAKKSKQMMSVEEEPEVSDETDESM